MNKKQQKYLTFGIIGIVIIVSSVFLYTSFINATPPAPPPIPPGEDVSFSMYQALRIVYPDGSDSWKYPVSRTVLQPLTIRDLDFNREVASIQSYVYSNLNSTSPVLSVAFNAEADISLYDLSLNFVASLTSGYTPVNYLVSNPELGTDVYITSASMTASEFETAILPYVPYGYEGTIEGWYVVSYRNIYADVTLQDGTTVDYGLTGVQSEENQLWWKFQYDSDTKKLSIVEAKWVWD